MYGVVKWFNQRDGYGFIVGDDGTERYFNVRQVVGADLPATGDVVQFTHEAGTKGPRAAEVTIFSRVTRDPGPGRVICGQCGKAMVPRLITYHGRPQKSLCPFCGETHAVFGPCFIATAVYGDTLAPEVIALRAFRDRHLAPSVWGRACIKAYYAISPGIADWLRQHGWAARVIRHGLDALVARLPPTTGNSSAQSLATGCSPEAELHAPRAETD